ncbi:Armadillo BTB protein ABAP1 [Glycine soja]|uniref:Armadillo BTB protein ABAP1 n=1 Tax=Glycine soja TaxID=3848 RepID=A0A445H6Y5_GLYSO|nr:Armadillo BTB protein ABAP1 [Glycine soja]
MVPIPNLHHQGGRSSEGNGGDRSGAGDSAEVGVAIGADGGGVSGPLTDGGGVGGRDGGEGRAGGGVGGGRRGGLKHLRRMRAAAEVDGAKLLNAAAEVDGATSLNAAAAMAVSPTHVVTSFNPARMRARPLLRERNYPDLIDERIINSHDVHQLFWIVQIAEKCLSREPQRRPNMIQVVDALTDIVEGRTCDIILRDYSPARLDSTYSTSGSDESEDEMQEPLRFEGELLSHSSESIESNNISQMMHMIVRQPPFPPIQCKFPKVHIVQRGVVQPLIEMLQSPDAGIAHNGGLVRLLKLLDSKNGSLQHNAAFALYGLADNE